MKSRIFIGSAAEALPVAESLQLLFEPEFEVQIWNQGVFELGSGFLESLTGALELFDFAVLVFSASDEVKIRGESFAATRDNVVFEMGLFAGGLGRGRTFCVSSESPPLKLPTDLLGVTYARYDSERFAREPRPALGAAASQIKEQMRRLGRRFSVEPPIDVEQFYYKTGLTEAFRTRQDSMNRMIQDIASAERSVSMLARVYISELIKATHGFAEAVQTAARGTAARSDRLTVTHISTDGDDRTLAERVWELEDPEKEEWATLDSYCSHLRRSDKRFKKVHEVLSDLKARLGSEIRPRIDLQRRYLDACLLPYSMLVIDSSIVYVSFYSLSKEKYGTFAPTMRLVCDDEGPDTWARAFLQEFHDIETKYSRPGPQFSLI